MNSPSKKHLHQYKHIPGKQQASVRCLQGSPSHPVGTSDLEAQAQDGASQPSSPRPPIRFYDKDKPYYSFTNFSPDPIYFNQQRYPTSEHLFQALKFMETYPELAESIRTCGESPRRAFDMAHEYQSNVGPNWKEISVTTMKLVLRAKFSQHTDLMQMLIDTGDAQLVEDSPNDAFWGIGMDGTGQNQLGLLLQEIRAELGFLENHLNLGKLRSVPFDSKMSPTSMESTGTPQKSGEVDSNRLQSHLPVKELPLCQVCKAKPRMGGSTFCSKKCKVMAGKIRTSDL